jgi:Cytotoxic translational repressor of toxin-antitoxin stability system
VAEHPYTVTLRPSARRELEGLPVAAQRSVVRAVDGLATNPRPRGSRLLRGKTAERIWRLRVGDYRVLYEIHDTELVVLVIRLGHRREVYRPRRAGG